MSTRLYTRFDHTRSWAKARSRLTHSGTVPPTSYLEILPLLIVISHGSTRPRAMNMIKPACTGHLQVNCTGPSYDDGVFLLLEGVSQPDDVER